MSRVCNRPGCDRPAVARLSYDPVGCQVWLDVLPERSGPAQEICELHTDRLTVPRGWMLCDRRAAEPALFVAPPPEPVEPVGAVTVVPSRRARPHIEPVPELFEVLDDPAAGAGPVPFGGAAQPELELVARERSGAEPSGAERPEPDDGNARTEARAPVPDQDDVGGTGPGGSDDTGGTDERSENGEDVDDGDGLPSSLRATSPLLSRAFRATGPQHSVLTQGQGRRRRPQDPQR